MAIVFHVKMNVMFDVTFALELSVKLSGYRVTPDGAKCVQMNREMHMVAYLNEKAGKKPASDVDIYL